MGLGIDETRTQELGGADPAAPGESHRARRPRKFQNCRTMGISARLDWCLSVVARSSESVLPCAHYLAASSSADAKFPANARQKITTTPSLRTWVRKITTAQTHYSRQQRCLSPESTKQRNMCSRPARVDATWGGQSMPLFSGSDMGSRSLCSVLVSTIQQIDNPVSLRVGPGVFTDARRDLQPGAFPPWPQAAAARPRCRGLRACVQFPHAPVRLRPPGCERAPFGAAPRSALESVRACGRGGLFEAGLRAPHPRPSLNCPASPGQRRGSYEASSATSSTYAYTPARPPVRGRRP